eukprot:5046728-Amphidinium_carterae.2
MILIEDPSSKRQHDTRIANAQYFNILMSLAMLMLSMLPACFLLMHSFGCSVATKRWCRLVLLTCVWVQQRAPHTELQDNECECSSYLFF